MTNAILLENLTKIYSSSKVAVDDVNLAIPEGSIFALLGPNGAGKSTIINILAGTVLKTSGKVHIGGIDLDTSPQGVKYKIGIVPQEIMIDTFFPVRKALEFYAGYYGIRPKDRKTDEILRALSLTDKAQATSRELSGGMKRRFLIAKAMVHSPKILVLDEPTAGVDIELRDQLWDYVKYLHSQGTTIILTTHYLTEAQHLCDHVAFINHGKIIVNDKKDHLLGTLGTRNMFLELAQEVPKDFSIEELSIVSANQNKLIVKFDEKTSSVSNIVSKLGKSGLEVKNLRIEQPDLESIFKQVIKK